MISYSIKYRFKLTEQQNIFFHNFLKNHEDFSEKMKTENLFVVLIKKKYSGGGLQLKSHSYES